MAVAPTDLHLIGDTDILKLDTDSQIRLFAWQEFPFLAMLEQVDAHGTDATDYWLNNVEGLNETTLSVAMTGGTASEQITVNSTAGFVVGHVIRFQENVSSETGQEAYISAIASSSAMTVNTFAGNLAAHASGTKVVMSGDRVKYGDTISQAFRLPTRASNTIEQVEAVGDLPFNMVDTELTNGQSIEDYLTQDAISQFKQKLTARALLGTERVASAAGGYGGMAGVANLIDAANVVSGTFDRANVRSFLSTIKRRGAFPAGEGILMVNDEALKDLYGFDDNNTGVSWRESDKILGDVRILGINFVVFVEPALNSLYIANKARMFAFTPKVKGRRLLRLAIKARSLSQGIPRKVGVTQSKYTLQIVRYCTVELLDPYRHGLYKQT